MPMKDFMQGIRNQYTKIRDESMGQLLGVGGHGAHPGDPHGTRIHVRANEGVLNNTPPIAWASLIPALQAAGVLNEVVGGLTEIGQGHPFMSENGFDPEDLAANQVGIGNALSSLVHPRRP